MLADPAARTEKLIVNSERLWASIMETAQFGGTLKGGVKRLTLSEEDKQARDWLVAAANSSGYATGIDDLGNIYIERKGTEPGRLPVAIGSHLDTQPTGGKFDGILGVLAGLEVLRTLDDAGIQTKAPLCLIDWTNEEGARFAPGELGSEVYAGEVERSFALSRMDADGISVADALEAIGYRGKERCGERRFSAMLELHIEQGPVLEQEKVAIGVVTAAKGQIWFNGVIGGRESHAGTTPMPLRKDALSAFAEFALAIERIANAEAPAGVGTIGVAVIGPGSRNTVPGSVRFSLEFRHPDKKRLEAMRVRALDAAALISRTRGCDVLLEPIWAKDPVQFSPQVADVIRESAIALGLSNRLMVSGAGHDACAVALKVPTAMIFVPCKDGISHNEAESATPEDCAAGANVLLHSALALAGRA
ncbi:Zn-dependent hydrolase [Terrihabitans soli]|uniref:Zn-dependent hydrolase n=1 Tax=Terrihabitans soli TaxID=708113 RepID=A0A6S6QLL9_9HYPH|nr:Zn-dependent hydrolase [Terrihabitans soli]BCJ92233.1 Zn-dependent hydrolase [Terrihabitans soli]